MHQERDPPEKRSDLTLVAEDMLVTALEESEEVRLGDEQGLLPGEPVLSAFLEKELFAILGKMALSGASAEIIRGVSAELLRLIVVPALAFQKGYHALIADLLPEDPHEDYPDSDPPAT